jgi:hypothetical protein
MVFPNEPTVPILEVQLRPSMESSGGVYYFGGYYWKASVLFPKSGECT